MTRRPKGHQTLWSPRQASMIMMCDTWGTRDGCLSYPPRTSFFSVSAVDCRTTPWPRFSSSPVSLRSELFSPPTAWVEWRSTPPEIASPAPRCSCVSASCRRRSRKFLEIVFCPSPASRPLPATRGAPAWARSCCCDWAWEIRTCRWCSGWVRPRPAVWGCPAPCPRRTASLLA